MTDRPELVQLERLNQLHRIGAVTQREYDAARRMILERLNDNAGASCIAGRTLAVIAVAAILAGVGQFTLGNGEAILGLVVADVGRGVIIAVATLIVAALAALVWREA